MDYVLIDNNINTIDAKYYAYPDKFIKHGSIKEIEKKYKLDVESIYNDIKYDKM